MREDNSNGTVAPLSVAGNQKVGRLFRRICLNGSPGLRAGEAQCGKIILTER